MVTSSTAGEIEQLEVQAEVLERLKDSMARMNERPGDWGIGPERPAEDFRVGTEPARPGHERTAAGRQLPAVRIRQDQGGAVDPVRDPVRHGRGVP